MNESHGLQFNVDTSGIAGGVAAYKSAVDGIFTSLDKFERTATKTFDAVNKAAANKANLSAYAKSMQGLGKIDIDATAARKIKGLSEAVAGFKAPSERQSGSLKAFFKSLNGLPDLTAATASVRTVAKLSASLDGFKAPSPGAAKNLRAFFKALDSMPDISGTARSIRNVADLGASLSGYKAPSPASAKNLVEFAKASSKAMPLFQSMAAMPNLGSAVSNLNSLSAALKTLKTPSTGQVTNLGNLGLVLRNFSSTNINGLSRIGTAISGISNFKAPTKAQIRNLDDFVKVVGAMEVPRNASAIADALNKITSAAGRANRELGGLRGNLGGINSGLRRTGRDAQQASLNMMGLQNAFSGTFQVGSVLRSLLGALTLGQLGREFFEASTAAAQFNAQMTVMNANANFASGQLSYINGVADKFGMEMLGVEKGFAKISIAASKTGLSVLDTRSVFEGFSTEMSVLGTSTERQGDVWLALQQVMNKGYLSAEELNQQLNEQLPGAMAYATEYANSLGMSLQDGLAKKALKANDVLTYMAKRMREDFGPGMADALNTPARQFTIMQNRITGLFQEIGKAGGNEAFTNLLKTINGALDPEAVKTFADAIGQGLVDAVESLSQAFEWLHDNWDSIKGPLGTTLKLIGEWMVVSSSLQIGRYMITPLLSLGTTLTGTVIPALRTANDTLRVMTMMSTAKTTADLRALVPAMAALSPAGLAAANAFRTMTVSLKAAWTAVTAMSVSSMSLSGALAGLKAAGAGAAAGLRGLMALVGGPFTIALGAAAAAAYLLYSEYSNVKALMADSQKDVAAVNKLLIDNHIASQTAAGSSKTFTSELDAGKIAMSEYTAKMDAQTDGLYSMAVQARDTAAALLEKRRAEIIGETAGLKAQNTDYIGAQAGKEWDNGEYGRSMAFRTYQGYTWLRQRLGGAPTNEQTQAQINQNEGAVADATRGLSVLNSEKWLKDEIERLRAGRSAPPKASPVSVGDDKAAKKAQDAFEAFSSSFNSFMAGIDGNDKVSKLLDGWSSTLTSGAKALLSPGGYADAMATVRDYSDGASSAAQGLINALTSGKLDKTALASLKKMHVTPEQIVADLKESIGEMDEKIVDAMVAMQTKKFKNISKALGTLATRDPELKINLDFQNDLAQQAQGLLSGVGMQQFLPSLDALQNGLLSSKDMAKAAEDATSKLISLLNSPQAAKSGLTAVIPQVTSMLNLNNAARERAVKQAERQATFGYDVMKSLRDETTQLSMSVNQYDTYTKLQEAVNSLKERGKEVTQGMVDALRQQIDAQRELNDTIRKTNELHDNNGIRQWAVQTMRAADFVNKLDNTMQTGLEDTLYRLGTKGKLSFTSLIDGIQSDIMRMASQKLTKSFTNAILGDNFNEDGSMNQKSKSWFNGLFGERADPATYKDSNVWAGMSSVADNPAYSPTYDDSTGLVKAFGDKMIPQQTQAFTTSLTNTLSFGADRSLRVLVTNPTASGTDGSALPGSLSDASPSANPDGAAASMQKLTKQADATASGMKELSTSAEGTGGVFKKLFGGDGKTGSAIAGAAGAGIGSAISGKSSGGTSAMLSMLAMLLPPPFNMLASGGIGLLGGLFGFREGGISGSAVGAPFSAGLYGSKFASAPHFSEGTTNTGKFAGGMPAVLHQNEAVIPLSRGRAVPVEFSGAGAMAQSQPAQGQSIVFNVTSPNPDSFRRSQTQLATQAYAVGAKAARRNM